MFRILMILAIVSLSCTTPHLKPVPKQCEDSCQALLRAKDGQMDKFRILCMAIAYAGSRHFDDPNVRREVDEGMRVCSYVYGND